MDTSSPYFDFHIKAIAKSNVPNGTPSNKIKEMIDAATDEYDQWIWGDYFSYVTIDEIKDTMSYFKDENIVK